MVDGLLARVVVFSVISLGVVEARVVSSPAPLVDSAKVLVWHGEEYDDEKSLSDPTVLRVQAIVDGVLARMPDSSELPGAVTDALRRAFPSESSKPVLSVKYKVVNSTLVCCGETLIELDFPETGPVLVLIELGTLL